jgi:hypothetical protein
LKLEEFEEAASSSSLLTNNSSSPRPFAACGKSIFKDSALRGRIALPGSELGAGCSKDGLGQDQEVIGQ